MLRGLEAIGAFPEVRPIKVNAVALRDFTEEEAIPFAEFARSTSLPGALHRVHAAGRRPRLVEGPGPDAARRSGRSSTASTRSRRLPREPHATARVFRFRDGAGEIGFINPVSEPFCADCNRIRLTADGKLRTCLFSIHETDLRDPLRSGATDAELEQVIRDAVWRKELKHRVGEPGFRQPPRTMSAIGGWRRYTVTVRSEGTPHKQRFDAARRCAGRPRARGAGAGAAAPTTARTAAP